ncbi:MAG: polyribonucleotide nucleotidyltransferase [Candidatus Roizmanbacteria bacterium]|nr:polyribonucleotide nucleotidyltransferase [Candidatus Roizmanbacteria bacterium]
MKQLEKTIDIDGHTLKLQFGTMAKAATSSVFASMGDTCVLVAVTLGKENKNIDYFPLQVEYVERLYAGGIIKGSRWVKREGKPTDEAILKGRIIDRSIRPLFPKTYRREVQVVVTLMSLDEENAPDILALNAVSAAVHISPAPWNGPVAATRIGRNKPSEGAESFIINPTRKEDDDSVLDLFVTSNRDDKVMMLETASMEVSNETIIQGIKLAKEQNKQIIEFMESIRKEIGQTKEVVSENVVEENLKKLLTTTYKGDLQKVIDYKLEKEYDDGSFVGTIVEKVMLETGETYESRVVAEAIDYLTKKLICSNTIETKKRIDGRGIDEIRALSAQVGILPRTHGTGLFTRGDTQVLSVATLGSANLEQLTEGPEGQGVKSYMHHYNFPPYSVGEAGRIGFTSRREIGHGALAEKAIMPVLPSQKEFPYAIRVVSEVLTSNGSTSMASTCGSSLALMDAGVPIKRPVAGIAMGMMSTSDDKYVILTDIMGIEDFSGEMDFKVTGTTEGVTAVQLDVKNNGLTDVMIEEIMTRAQNARLKIIEVMNGAISTHRADVSQYAPTIVEVQLKTEDIGTVIGPGGKMIRSIIAKTETEINVDDEGKVTIAGVDRAKVAEAADTIRNLVREIQVGEEFRGEVKRLMAFGAFVEVVPGKEGLVHVSKMSSGFVKDPGDIVKLGDIVKVKVYEVDSQGRINLQLTELPDGTPVEIQNTAPPTEDRRSGGGGYDRGDRNSRPQRRDNRRRF